MELSNKKCPQNRLPDRSACNTSSPGLMPPSSSPRGRGWTAGMLSRMRQRLSLAKACWAPTAPQGCGGRHSPGTALRAWAIGGNPWPEKATPCLAGVNDASLDQIQRQRYQLPQFFVTCRIAEVGSMRSLDCISFKTIAAMPCTHLRLLYFAK